MFRNIRNIITFINNIIIEIKIEEKYDNIVKKVLRKIVEVKPNIYIYNWQTIINSLLREEKSIYSKKQKFKIGNQELQKNKIIHKEI